MPRNVKIFISSTCKDLKQDCRCRAIETIERTQNAEPVAMEKWYDDYGHTVEMCLQKLKGDSTHFLGIFAYRYGWRPAGPMDVSITEKEFDLAYELKRKMFILIPEEGSPIHVELLKRAEDQPDEDKAAQQAFLRRVGGQVCRPFKDVADLVSWVTHKIRDWQEDAGGLRALAAASGSSVKAPPRKTLESLGRVTQTRTFEDCLRDHVSATFPELACFLVHGKAGYGHEELLQRLQDKLSDRDVLTITVDAGSTWRSKDVSAVLEIIGKELGESFASISELAARLKQELTTLDVVIRFDNLQRLNISLSTFIEEFWKPLTQSFGPADTELAQRLIGLAGYKGALDANVQPLLFTPGAGVAFDNTQLIDLPMLDDFTETDLFVWLKQQKMPPAKAKAMANKLMQETGGNPPALFQELLKEALWND